MIKISDIDQKPEEYMNHVNGFVNDPKGFFIIAGNNGTGKTFTARAIYDWFYHPHGDNLFYNLMDLKINWQGLYAKNVSTEYLYEQLKQAPLLILDDLGFSRPSESSRNNNYN